MTRITEGHLVRHYQGVKGGRDAALLDIAQDHALHLLHDTGLFDRGLVFKGGTALRKFRAGTAGRFSTDLDFAAPNEELALSALQALDAGEIDGFAFSIENLGDDGRRGDLKVETPFGRPQIGAKVELARHALSLEPEMLDPVRLPIHDRYDFALAPTPVVRAEEAVSEKLARYRRVSLARDLYDCSCSRPRAYSTKRSSGGCGCSRSTATSSPTAAAPSPSTRPRCYGRGIPTSSARRILATSPSLFVSWSGSPPSAAGMPSSVTSTPMGSAGPNATSVTATRSTRHSRRFATRT